MILAAIHCSSGVRKYWLLFELVPHADDECEHYRIYASRAIEHLP